MGEDFSRDAIRHHAEHSIFGSRVVDNRFRPILVEAMVDLATSEDWHWCSENWSGHDFEHTPSGTKLEVKQSAARQSWHDHLDSPSALRFDIRKCKGTYVRNEWVPFDAPRRIAHVYLFAAHLDCSANADHHDPAQWRFFVMPERMLLDRSTVSLEWLLERKGLGISIGEVQSVLMDLVGASESPRVP